MASYSGSLTYTVTGSVPGLSETNLDLTATLSWAMTYDGKTNGPWELSKLSGSMTESADVGANAAQCAMTFGLASSSAGGMEYVGPIAGGKYRVRTSGWPIDNIAVTITGNNDQAFDCNAGAWNLGNGTEWVSNLPTPRPPGVDPVAVFRAGSSATRPFNMNLTCASASGCSPIYLGEQLDGTAAYKLTSKVSFTSVPQQKLEIFATVAGDRSAVQDTTKKLVVGQHVTLEAQFADGATLGSPDWTGITPADLVDSYTWVPHKGEVTAFDTKNLKKKEFSFYWIGGGTNDVSVTAVDTKTGHAYKATAVFDVQTPQVTEFSARTCALGLARRDPPGVTVMSFGDNHSCFKVAGVKWKFQVKAPEAAGGKAGVTQILTDTLDHDGTACSIQQRDHGVVKESYLANGQFKAVDNEFWYSPPIQVKAGDQTKVVTDSDSPEIGLTNAGTWSDKFEATDWLMFRPDGTDSIPVAIRSLQWNFHGVARWEHEAFSGAHVWKLVHSSGTERQALASAEVTRQEPTWTRLIVNGNDIAGCNA